MTQKSGTLDWDIEEWLENLGMDEYVDIFVDNGYDIPQLVASMTNKDLDAMHIREPEHRRILLKEAAKIPKDKPPPKPRRTFKFNTKKEAPDIKVPREGLSRLQLKLKVGAELKNDKLDITAPPYSTADGLADTVALFNLSKKYAAEFKVNIEDTYNVVMDIWKSRTEAEVNIKSVFSPEIQTPVTSPSVQGPTENYDEIFTTSLEKKPVRVRGKSSTEKPPNPRPLTPSAAQVSDIQTLNSARPLTPEIQYKKLRRFLESFDKKSHVPGTSPAALFRLDDSEIWNGNGPIPEDVRIDLMTRFCEGELSVDQVVEKVMQHEEKRSSHNLTAFDDNEDPKQTTSEAPLRKNVAIRTTSEESVYNSPKTSLGRSTDSDSSSPSGSPEVTRKKRVWERNGKVKETFMALEDSEESSEDVKKDKKQGKPKFLQKVTKKLFSSRSKSKSTAESNSDKEKDISMTRTQSSPAIAGEKNSEVPEDTMANYSQPFDSIVPSTSSSKDSAVQPKGKLPPRYTQKQISTLPHDFSPSNMKKSPSLNEINTTKTSALNSTSGRRKKPSSEEYAMRNARLNGNLNCSLDSEDAPLRAGSPSSSSYTRDTSLPDTQESSIPNIPPRTYTPPPEEEVPIPPHPDDYYITDNGKDTTHNKSEHGKRSYGGASGRLSVSPSRQVIPALELSPVKEEGRQEETSSSQPPKKPKRHQRRSGSATFIEEAGKSGGPISTETTPTASLPETNLEHKEQCDEDISTSKPSIPRKPSRLKKMVIQKVAIGESPKTSVSRESPQPEQGDATSVDPVKKSQPPAVTRQQQVIQKVAIGESPKTSVSRESPQPEQGVVTSVEPVKKSHPPAITRQQRVTSPRRTAPPPPVPQKKKTSSTSEQPVSSLSSVPLPRTVTLSDTSGLKLPPRGRVSVTPTDPLLWQQTRSPGSPSLPPKPSKLKYGFRSRSLENVFDSTERDTVDERPTPPPKPIPARPPKSAHLQNLSRPVSEVPASWREQPQANSIESLVGSSGNVQGWRTPPPRRLANRQPSPGLPGNLVTKPTIPPKPLFRAKSPSPQQRIEAIAVLEKKLEKERICLSECPYSNINGDCGIPPMMAQRYSRETGLSLDIVEQSLDFIRLHLLQKLDRPATASSKEYWKSTPTVSTTSVSDWLVSIGLPFYKESFSQVQLHSIREIPSITSGHMRALNLLDPSHKEYINEGIKYLLAQIMH